MSTTADVVTNTMLILQVAWTWFMLGATRLTRLDTEIIERDIDCLKAEIRHMIRRRS